MHRVLERLGVPTPERIEVNRDGGPRVAESLRQKFLKKVRRFWDQLKLARRGSQQGLASP